MGEGACWSGAGGAAHAGAAPSPVWFPASGRRDHGLGVRQSPGLCPAALGTPCGHALRARTERMAEQKGEQPRATAPNLREGGGKEECGAEQKADESQQE